MEVGNMNFLLFLGPIIGVAVAIFAVVVIIIMKNLKTKYILIIIFWGIVAILSIIFSTR